MNRSQDRRAVQAGVRGDPAIDGAAREDEAADQVCDAGGGEAEVGLECWTSQLTMTAVELASARRF